MENMDDQTSFPTLLLPSHRDSRLGTGVSHYENRVSENVSIHNHYHELVPPPS
jgi:hypothetical protein